MTAVQTARTESQPRVRRIADGPAAGRNRGESVGRAHPWEVLFGPWSVGVALVVVLGAVYGAVQAGPAGLGLDLCWFRRLSGLPCPGCGLTRAVLALARGELRSSLAFHPFGVLVLSWALVAVSSRLWPPRLRERVAVRLGRARGAFDRAYRAFLVAFVGFGILRTLGVVLGVWRVDWPGGAFGL